ncbi:hypothetical protein ACPF8X_39770, partial [Streptomyces sp. G35A]
HSGTTPMRRSTVLLASAMLLLTACATAPSGPQQTQLVCPALPDPGVKHDTAQALTSIFLMRNFLSGSLPDTQSSQRDTTSYGLSINAQGLGLKAPKK